MKNIHKNRVILIEKKSSRDYLGPKAGEWKIYTKTELKKMTFFKKIKKLTIIKNFNKFVKSTLNLSFNWVT